MDDRSSWDDFHPNFIVFSRRVLLLGPKLNGVNATFAKLTNKCIGAVRRIWSAWNFESDCAARLDRRSRGRLIPLQAGFSAKSVARRSRKRASLADGAAVILDE
jgi:hypothetical protein